MDNAPFTGIAHIYDRLMADVDYITWVNYIEKLFKFARRPVKRVLDIACGTCTPTLILKERGYEVFGIDLSFHMLKVARSKDPKLPLVMADMREFSFLTKFDAIISIFDSINNLLTEEELLKTFRNVLRHLEHGGIFIFDMNTIRSLKEYWGDDVKIKEFLNLVSIWRTSYNDKRRTSILDITVFYKDDYCWKRVDETHIERGYPLKVIKKLLKESGFSKFELFHHLTFKNASEKSLRFTAIAINT